MDHRPLTRHGQVASATGVQLSSCQRVTGNAEGGFTPAGAGRPSTRSLAEFNDQGVIPASAGLLACSHSPLQASEPAQYGAGLGDRHEGRCAAVPPPASKSPWPWQRRPARNYSNFLRVVWSARSEMDQAARGSRADAPRQSTCPSARRASCFPNPRPRASHGRHDLSCA